MLKELSAVINTITYQNPEVIQEIGTAEMRHDMIFALRNPYLTLDARREYLTSLTGSLSNLMSNKAISIAVGIECNAAEVLLQLIGEFQQLSFNSLTSTSSSSLTAAMAAAPTEIENYLRIVLLVLVSFSQHQENKELLLQASVGEILTRLLYQNVALANTTNFLYYLHAMASIFSHEKGIEQFTAAELVGVLPTLVPLCERQTSITVLVLVIEILLGDDTNAYKIANDSIYLELVRLARIFRNRNAEQYYAIINRLIQKIDQFRNTILIHSIEW
jgi:hypothetical protein